MPILSLELIFPRGKAAQVCEPPKQRSCMILYFRRQEAENFAFMGHHVQNSGNFLPTFRDNLSLILSLRLQNKNLNNCSIT